MISISILALFYFTILILVVLWYFDLQLLFLYLISDLWELDERLQFILWMGLSISTSFFLNCWFDFLI